VTARRRTLPSRARRPVPEAHRGGRKVQSTSGAGRPADSDQA
jgi:hypothetical protein